MTRLLVDMNLSTEWIPLLQAAGQLLRRLHARLGLRHDARALSGAHSPSVLQVRCLNVLPEVIGTLVLALLKIYGAEMDVGSPIAVSVQIGVALTQESLGLLFAEVLAVVAAPSATSSTTSRSGGRSAARYHAQDSRRTRCWSRWSGPSPFGSPDPGAGDPPRGSPHSSSSELGLALSREIPQGLALAQILAEGEGCPLQHHGQIQVLSPTKHAKALTPGLQPHGHQCRARRQP